MCLSQVDEAGEGGVPETPPTLNQFKEQVDSYEKIHKEVEKFQVLTVLHQPMLQIAYLYELNFFSLRVVDLFSISSTTRPILNNVGQVFIARVDSAHVQTTTQNLGLRDQAVFLTLSGEFAQG